MHTSDTMISFETPIETVPQLGPISGFKHVIPPIVAAAIAGRFAVEIRNVPAIDEPAVLATLVQRTGMEACYDASKATFTINGRDEPGDLFADDLTAHIHGSLYLLPAIAARRGSCRLYVSGGCPIGAEERGVRPTHHIYEVARRFGGKLSGSSLCFPAGVKGAVVDVLDFSSAGGTVASGPLVSGASKSAAIVALAAPQESVILNPYAKVDFTALSDMIQLLGRGQQRTNHSLVVAPRGQRTRTSASMVLPPDLCDIVSRVAMSVIWHEELTLEGLQLVQIEEWLASEFLAFRAMGVSFVQQAASVVVIPPGELQPVTLDVRSNTIYSDNAHMLALMFGISGTGWMRIRDGVWPARLRFLDKLSKFGLRTRRSGDWMEIQGGSIKANATWKEITADDLREAAMLSVLGARLGKLSLRGVEHLSRGFDQSWREVFNGRSGRNSG